MAPVVVAVELLLAQQAHRGHKLPHDRRHVGARKEGERCAEARPHASRTGLSARIARGWEAGGRVIGEYGRKGASSQRQGP